MRLEEGRLAVRAAPGALPVAPAMKVVPEIGAAMATGAVSMLYYSMKHRTQLDRKSVG